MKTLLKNTVASCILLFTYSSFALTIGFPGFPGESGLPLHANDLKWVIDSTAEATLNPDGSEEKSNCRKDSHCKVLRYKNNCSQVNFSTYKARGAENAISDLTILHDSDIILYFGCVRPITEGVCVKKRCKFEDTGEIVL